MNKWLSSGRERFDRMSLRERALVAGCALLGVIILWFQFAGDPAWQQASRTDKQLKDLQKNLDNLRVQQQTLQAKQQLDPLRELRQRLDMLEQHIAGVDKQLGEKLHGLIAPQQMAQVLEAVLHSHRDLTLLKLQSLAPVAIRAERGTSESDNAEAPGVALYRHGLQVEFEGNYLATLNYLKALQELPWEFYWDEVRLDVEQYPKARVVITVHTLSLKEGWIGV